MGKKKITNGIRGNEAKGNQILPFLPRQVSPACSWTVVASSQPFSSDMFGLKLHSSFSSSSLSYLSLSTQHSLYKSNTSSLVLWRSKSKYEQCLQTFHGCSEKEFRPGDTANCEQLLSPQMSSLFFVWAKSQSLSLCLFFFFKGGSCYLMVECQACLWERFIMKRCFSS